MSLETDPDLIQLMLTILKEKRTPVRFIRAWRAKVLRAYRLFRIAKAKFEDKMAAEFRNDMFWLVTPETQSFSASWGVMAVNGAQASAAINGPPLRG